MMSSPLRKTSCALLVLVAVIQHANAEQEGTDPGKSTLLDQVTVSATRTEHTLDSVASSVTVETAGDMEKNMMNNIRDLVKYEPGLEVTSDGRFGLGSFNIRGMDENRVKIIVDGVDQAKAFDSTKFFLRSQRNYVDIDSMKQVEIVKGPASAMYGSDAIGGLVAFTTKDPADYLHASGNDSYASIKTGYASANHEFSETITLANRVGDVETMLLYTRRDGQERDTHGELDIPGAERETADPQDFGINSLLGKLQYQLNDTNRIGITGEWQDNNTETDVQSMIGYEASGGDTYSQFMADDMSTRSRVGVFHEVDANNIAFDYLKWQLNWQLSETNQVTTDSTEVRGGDIQQREKDYIYSENSWQFDTTFNKSLLTGDTEHLLSYGLSYEHKDQDNLNKTTYLQNPSGKESPEISRYAPLSTIDSVGVYLQDEIALMSNKLTITPGFRYDHFVTNVNTTDYTPISSELAPKDQQYDSWTGQLGTVYRWNGNLSLFAQYSQGFGTPDAFAMYFYEEVPGVVTVLPNPDLKPEESDSIEAGVRLTGNLGSAEVTGYYSQYENFIEQIFLGQGNLHVGTFQYQNLDEATIKGLEFKSELWLDETIHAPVGTRLRTTFAWAHGRGTMPNKDDVVQENEPLNSVAPFKAVFALGYDASSEMWGSELVWTLVSDKDEENISQGDRAVDDTADTSPQYATAGYGLLDLTAYYKPAGNVTFNAGLFNLTDKEYYIWDDVRGVSAEDPGILRYSQPGRNFSVSFKWEI